MEIPQSFGEIPQAIDSQREGMETVPSLLSSTLG